MKLQSLSPRERVELALNHQETDRIPIAMVCSGINPAAHRALSNHLQKHRNITVDAYLNGFLDVRGIQPDYRGPALTPGTDLWGVRREAVSYGDGTYKEISFHPLASATTVDDLENHRWPSTDWFDYAGIPAKIQAIQREGDYYLMTSNGNIFETSWFMRGFENIFMDLATDPDWTQALLERVTRFYLAHFRKILEAADGQIGMVFTADDIAGQNGLLMSLDTWKHAIKPWHIQLNRLIHEFGVKVIYHSDGAVMEAIPELIDMGVDILQALQFDARGMDPVAMKTKYGDRLCFEGGVSVQKTLPFGTPEDVRREVIDRIRILGKNGGYILGPSHTIQDGTPPENVTALFDTAATDLKKPPTN